MRFSKFFLVLGLFVFARAQAETNILYPAQLQHRASVRPRPHGKIRRAHRYSAARKHRAQKLAPVVLSPAPQPISDEKLAEERAWKERQDDEKLFQEVLGERR